ncbi:hypothetical protein I551_2432 [Mycobacterium ulcerans str. Harvey]|uniref:Uncharacterized protein n=1 Tax=Mycobacterium ulcerans str. Harvey TaxID=1299332 RepID=A0ABP3AIS4_MYCUL|nr:hypothetical protein I551_2432 [Mycobacterium ulcerans str. Harvey]
MVGVSAHALANLGSPSSLARTALLLAGALLCLSVAAWPVLSQRRRQHPETQEQMFAGTNVPYAAPPQRRQSDGGRLTIAALICAAGFVAAVWLPSKSTMPARPLVALPGASAIARAPASPSPTPTGQEEWAAPLGSWCAPTPAGPGYSPPATATKKAKRARSASTTPRAADT